MPKISVVIPCYNHAQYLPDAVRSLIGGRTCLGDVPPQTFQNFNIIIVNDASTDSTAWESAALAKEDQRIRVLCLESNLGTAGALNAGIEIAEGEYIYILAADDMVEPWALETMLEGCKLYPHSVVYGNLRILQSGNRNRHWKLAQYDFQTIIEKNPMPAAGVMYPRRCWEKVGGYPAVMRYGREGWAFNIACGLAEWCGQHIGESGYLYRWDGQNKSLLTSGEYPKVPAPDGLPNWRVFFQRQIEQLFPQVFDGRVNVAGCCGGARKSSKPVPATRAKAAVLPGMTGYKVLQYIGPSAGRQTFYADNTTYKFGKSKPLGYVANEHVSTLLSMRGKDDAPLFVVVEPPAPKSAPVPVPATPPPTEPEPIELGLESVEPEPEPVELAFEPEITSPVEEEQQQQQLIQDPSALTVSEIKELDLTPDEAIQMLEAERVGKGRYTAIAYLRSINE